jgi:hypothetical protein
MHKFIVLISFLFFIINSQNVQAFPNMVRHGYTTCVTCHYNASGGGSLTSYGKYIAGETLGTFNNSETALPWLTKPAEYEDKNKEFGQSYVVAFMGRGVQYQFDTDTLKRVDRRFMQADLEGAIDYKDWVALLTVGPRLDSKADGQEDTDLFVRRWYVGRQELNYSIKAGQFFPEYGIYLPNHNAATRRRLFFNHDQEPHTIQASYFTPSFDFTVARLSGRRGTVIANQNGYSSTVAYKSGSSRFGVSMLKVTDDPKISQSTSFYGTLGYGTYGYTLFEVAKKQITNIRENKTENTLGYVESGWEVYNGVIPFVNWEFDRNDTAETLYHAPGIGLQFTPWTHTELWTQYARTYTPGSNGYSIYTMLNVYF